MTVTLEYDIFWEALGWAKKNCPSYITNAGHQDEHGKYDVDKIDYFFADDRDAVAFMLRWQ